MLGRKLRSFGAGSLLAVCPLLGCALKAAPDAEQITGEALPETTQISEQWTAPEWDTGQVDIGWIARFGDSELDTLVDEAITNNLNLRVASARVDRAAGVVELARAGLLPVVGVGANAAVVGGNSLPVTPSGSGGASISWEADVWGRLRSGVSAAEYSLEAAQADLEGARLSLVSQTAKAWFLAQELRMQARFAEEIVDALSKLTAIMRKKLQVGAVSGEALFLSEADLAAAEDALRQIRVAETRTVRLLELLLGRYPAASLEASGVLVAVPPSVPAGMPSELLERRPDLVAAERRVAAAFRLEEQARLARMPRFVFSGGLGGASDLAGVVGNFMAGVAVPIYAPALQAQIAIASADQQAALAAYGQTVLRALEEVETALFNDYILAEREQFLSAQVEANRKALEIHRRQLEVGKITTLPVLQVLARYVGSQVLLTSVRNQRLAQRVDLHLALGGSF